MTLRLTEDTVNTQHVVQYLIEQYQRHVQFFLIEHLQYITDSWLAF